jgi:lipoyl(octanoyl) transferase
VVAYLMMDLRRMGLSIRSFVCAIEQGVIDYLGHWKVAAVRQPGAPGVYLQAPPHGSGAKIASLGIKISRGCSYHGVALNADMDLEPFARIDPCGYPGLAVTDLRSALGLPRGALDLSMLAQTLASCLSDAIGAAAASAVQTCGAAQVAAPSSQTR